MTAPHRSDALLSLIGNTALIPLRFESEGLTILAKAEVLNSSGSVKDRLARSIILDAEERGLLTPDSIILKCTSGNTGIALAMVGSARGYRVRIVMSTTASIERRTLLRRLGAELVLFETGANRELGPKAKVVTILCDRAERYFSTALFGD